MKDNELPVTEAAKRVGISRYVLIGAIKSGRVSSSERYNKESGRLVTCVKYSDAARIAEEVEIGNMELAGGPLVRAFVSEGSRKKRSRPAGEHSSMVKVDRLLDELRLQRELSSTW